MEFICIRKYTHTVSGRRPKALVRMAVSGEQEDRGEEEIFTVYSFVLSEFCTLCSYSLYCKTKTKKQKTSPPNRSSPAYSTRHH